MNDQKLPNRQIVCIDMVSFYASCMAKLHHLDVQKVPIAVVGDLERSGSVVLAASPPMKKQFGVKTGMRLYEIPKHPTIRLFNPKMSYFLEMSMAVTRLLHEYVPIEAIHVYSIDESFIDLTGTEKLWGNPVQTAQKIQEEIYRRLQLPSRAGMGPNRLIAKLALDLEAKRSGFTKWTYADIPTKLWPVQPVSKMWGIGRQTEKKLNRMGIFSVGDLAHADIRLLEGKFGVLGNEMYYHARGIDLSSMTEPRPEEQVSYAKSQILLRDYHSRAEVKVVLLEMCEEVARRARNHRQVARTIALTIGYSKTDSGGGFRRTRTIQEGTNDTLEIYRICLALFAEHGHSQAVRQIAVSIMNLENEVALQLSLFDKDKWKNRQLGATMDQIYNRYGARAIMRAVSLTDAGTAISRSKLVGGHKE